jgi:putative oxidoreductase
MTFNWISPLHLETLGRWGLVSLFIIGGVHKAVDPATPLRMMDSVGMAPAWLLLPMVIGLELGGGLVVAAGRRGAVPMAIVLAAYTVLVNLVFHRFWILSGHEFELEISLFFKNMAIAGGLLMIAGRLAGRNQH